MFVDRLSADLKDAMKGKEEQKTSTLRMLLAALKNKKIDLQHDLTDEEALAVVQKQVKSLQDSMAQFTAGGRADLAEGVKKEMEILAPYLPAQMTDVELEAIVKEALLPLGALTKADMGRAMGAVMPKVAGKADGGRVKDAVQKHLG